MCVPIFMFTYNLQSARAIQTAQEVNSSTSQWLSISPEIAPNLCQAFQQWHSSSAQRTSREKLNFGSWSHIRGDERFDPSTRVNREHQNPQLNCPKMFGDVHCEYFPEQLQEVLNSVCCWRNISEAQTFCMFTCLYMNIKMLSTWTTKSLFSLKLEICFA